MTAISLAQAGAGPDGIVLDALVAIGLRIAICVTIGTIVSLIMFRLGTKKGKERMGCLFWVGAAFIGAFAGGVIGFLVLILNSSLSSLP